MRLVAILKEFCSVTRIAPLLRITNSLLDGKVALGPQLKPNAARDFLSSLVGNPFFRRGNLDREFRDVARVKSLTVTKQTEHYFIARRR